MIRFLKKSAWILSTLILFAIAFYFSTCGSSNPYNTPMTYYSTMDKLVLEVAYEPGATPYTEAILGTGSLWDFAEANLNALFDGRKTQVAVTVPKTISEMTAIPSQGKTSFTADEILNISNRYQKGHSTAKTAYFFIVFLNGYYNDNGTAKQSVIGASIPGTAVIGMFKPVILSTKTGQSDSVPKYVEQSTIIHEMGHALGLVNNGVPMTAQHQDTSRGHHCTNPDCVMYWSNEGAADLSSFIQNLKQGQIVVYGQECLDDTRSYQP